MLHVDANLHCEIRRGASAIPAPLGCIFLFCRGFLCPRTGTLQSAACNYSTPSHGNGHGLHAALHPATRFPLLIDGDQSCYEYQV